MSWFLGSSKKKKPKRQWVKQAKKTSTWDPARWYPLMRGLFVVGTIALLGIGYVVGREALMRKVAVESAAAVQVQFVQVPAWMRKATTDRMARDMAQVISADPLDRKTLVAAEQVLAGNAWVERVLRVERHREGHVLVLAQFRKPVAMVEARDGIHLIDAGAHLLPGIYDYEQVKGLGLPVITGSAIAPPAPGQVWPGADVAAGLKLAALMNSQPFADQVRGIDVANYGGRRSAGEPQLLILTANGTIRWGLPPGEEGFREPDAQKKLAMLRRVAASARGQIDGGGKVVNVSIDQPLTYPVTEQARYTSSGQP